MLRMAAVTNMTEQLNFFLFTFNSDFLLQSQLTVLQLANFYPHTLTFPRLLRTPINTTQNGL